MSLRFEPLQQTALYPDAFGVPAPTDAQPRDMWPRKLGVFLRAAAPAEGEVALPPDTLPETSTADASTPDVIAKPLASRELVLGQWGLVPPWVKSASDAKLRSPKLVNARSETVSTSKNFYDAWTNGQRCIVPMMSFCVDDWRSGKAVPTRITRVDGKPMGVAGLWELWKGKPEADTPIVSFTLLTVNANNHALMHRYEQQGSEKRMPAILNEGAYDAWLTVRHEKAREFMRAYAANWLTANPVQ